MFKIAIGLAMAFVIGLGCSFFAIPVPAPPVLTGALLVVAMTLGWTATDYFFAHRPKKNEKNCGGPSHGPTREGL